MPVAQFDDGDDFGDLFDGQRPRRERQPLQDTHRILSIFLAYPGKNAVVCLV